jgi:hypothetical protein
MIIIIITKILKFLAGVALLLLAGLLLLFLQAVFALMSAPCTACVNLSVSLYQTLSFLAPALASLTGAILLGRNRES